MTALLLGVAIATSSSSLEQWELAAVLTISATLAQLFKVEAPNNQTYFATTIFLFAGVLLLNPPLFALVVIVSYLVEWAKERIVQSPLLRLWYLQPFNICTHVLAGFAAKSVYDFFAGYVGDFSYVYGSFSLLLGVVASAVTYVTVNHLMVGLALVLARGVSWKESGILDVENLSIEAILLFMGAVTAVLWTINPWLILPALSPLVLMYKALMIPQLKRDAQIDAKTGLFNARHFTVLFTAEVERAQRFSRPLSLIMADLDLLRNINNTYGHLAGDLVLGEMGRVIKETIREYDIAGRFGGEEFAIVLPEVDLEEARVVSERLREVVESTHVMVGTSAAPIHVTMSLGVATLNPVASTLNSLLHEADIAVYHAKLRGRNCVVCVSEIPHLDDFGSVDPEARLAMPYVPRFVPRPEPPGDVVRSQGG
jgi:diguanylate cyclase (GGDEF)-like protein